MRKYAIAGLGAIAAFSMSAFASSLVVDGSALQAGVDASMSCAQNAEVEYITSTSSNQAAPSFFIDKVVVTVDSGTCVDEHVFLEARKSASETTWFAVSDDPIGADGTVTIDLANYPRVDELNRIDVMIKKAQPGEAGFGTTP